MLQTTTPVDPGDVRKETIDCLDDMLCAERAAVDCYESALEKLKEDPVPELRDVQRSHQARIETIRARLIGLGGTPSDSTGLSAGFTKLLNRLAQLFGRSSTLNALEECEDRCLRQYRELLARADADTRAFIEDKVLAEQIRTHDLMRAVQLRCC